MPHVFCSFDNDRLVTILNLWKQADRNAEAQLDHAKLVQRKVRRFTFSLAVIQCNTFASAGVAVPVLVWTNQPRDKVRAMALMKIHPKLQVST